MADTDTPNEAAPRKAEIVGKFTVPGVKALRYRSWCDQHEDGYQGGKRAAESWATKHNAAHHPEEGQ